MIVRCITLLLFLIGSPLNAQTSPERVIQDIDQLFAIIKEQHASTFWITAEDELLKVILNTKNKLRKKESLRTCCFL